MRRFVIEKLGGLYVKNDKDKAKVLTLAVRDLFNTISADDILTESKGEWLAGGKPITPAELKSIIVEAEFILNSRLWKYLKKEIQYRANKSMYERAQSEMDLTAGKMFLYALDTIQTRLNSLVKNKK